MANTQEKVVNYYDRRSLIAVEDELKKPLTFLSSKFFPNIKEFATEAVDVDIYKGKRRAAAYSKRNEPGATYTKVGFETNPFTPPYLSPVVSIFPSDLRKRVPGESLFVNGQLDLRAQDYIGSQIDEVDQNVIQAAIEVQCMQALFDKSVKCYDKDGNLIKTITYDYDSSIHYSVSAARRWSAADVVILDEGKVARRLSQKLSGFRTDIALVGSDAEAYFSSNDLLQKSLSKDWSSRGKLAYDLSDNGGVWLGYAEGIDYWSFDEYYIDPADSTEKLVVPSKKVLYGSSKAIGSICYGALELTDQIMGARAIKTWAENNPEVSNFQIHSSPLAVLHHPNAFIVATVLL